MDSFLVVKIFFCFIVVNARPDIPEEDMLEELLYNYNKDARPATNYEPTIYVTHTLTLNRIVSIEDDIVTLDVWQNLRWTDPRLTWDPEDFGPLSISLRVARVWTPDILLYNIAGPTDGYVYKDVNVILHHTGGVTWVPAMRLVTYCDTSNRDAKGAFTCMWKFGSWTLDAFKINITNPMRNGSVNAPDIDMSNYIPSKKFAIVKTEVVINEGYYECCPEPYQDITYYITFKRKSAPTQSDAPAQNEASETEIGTQTETHSNETSGVDGEIIDKPTETVKDATGTENGENKNQPKPEGGGRRRKR